MYLKGLHLVFENYASLFTHILDKKTSQDELNLWFTKAIGLFNEKYVGHTLDERLNFTEYIISKTSKCDKLTGISKNCQSSFKWMYWYCHDKAKTSVICKQNRTRLNIELVPFKGRLWGGEGGDSLLWTRIAIFNWFLNLSFFKKNFNGLSPQYLCFYLNLNNNSTYVYWKIKYSLFHFSINEWNKL